MNGETSQSITLVVRRVIRATRERLFDAWTQPDHLMQWWGPPGVNCPGADVDLRIGGIYRIANQLPNGDTLWIAGQFEHIDPPRKLIYSWGTDPTAAASERVTVQFETRDDATEVIIIHERIATAPMRDGHEQGWNGCLDGLERYLAGEAPPAD